MPSPDLVPRALWDCGHHVPTRPRAREALLAALDEGWADPTRLHREGRAARALLDGAREALAARLGVRTEEVGLTSSFARAVQTGMLGTLRGRSRVGNRLVHTAVDHSAVLGCVRWQVEDGGAAVELSVDGDGRVAESAFAASVAEPGVALAVRQFGNGEVGTLQPLEAAAQACHAAGVPLLVDAGAAAGHVDLPRADLLVVDGGSWGAPPGGGVIAVRSGVRWRRPWPQEGPGPAHTPAVTDQVSVPQALAMAVAAEDAAAEQAAADGRRRRAVDRLRARLPELVPDVQVVGDPVHRLPHILTFSVLFADGEALVEELDRAGFAVGSGSACAAGALHPSHVLAAMGVLTHGNVRIALPAHVDEPTLQRQVAAFEQALPGIVTRVRERVGGAGL